MSDPWDALENPYDIFLRDVQEGGLENSVARRYYAKYESLVISNVDPSCQGRVQLRVFALNRDTPIDIWAYPSAPFAGPDYGIYFPPEIGDRVWVWFDHGHPDFPNFSGAWWLAPAKTSESSHVPNEFKGVLGTSPGKRGIKTKQGHGLLFDDTTLLPKVELWSGKQAAPGLDAVKKNLITLSDIPGQERLTLETALKHSLKLIDAPVGTNGVVLETLAGIRLFFDETLQLARISTPAKRSVVIDDKNTILSLTTTTGSIAINDASQTLDITSQGQVNITGVGVSINSTSGLQKQEGIGSIEQEFTGDKLVKITGNTTTNVTGKEDHNVQGVYQQQITGAASLTFLGGLILAVTGTATFGGLLAVAAGVTVGVAAPGAVTLGALSGVFFRLVTEAFITQYNANVAIHNANVTAYNLHTHALVGNLGPSETLPPLLFPQSPVNIVAPSSATTSTTVAN